MSLLVVLVDHCCGF